MRSLTALAWSRDDGITVSRKTGTCNYRHDRRQSRKTVWVPYILVEEHHSIKDDQGDRRQMAADGEARSPMFFCRGRHDTLKKKNCHHH